MQALPVNMPISHGLPEAAHINQCRPAIVKTCFFMEMGRKKKAVVVSFNR